MDHGIPLSALPLMEFILQIKPDPLLEYIDIMLLSIYKEQCSRRLMSLFLVYAQHCYLLEGLIVYYSHVVEYTGGVVDEFCLLLSLFLIDESINV
jgi:hypothetical protein